MEYCRVGKRRERREEREKREREKKDASPSSSSYLFFYFPTHRNHLPLPASPNQTSGPSPLPSIAPLPHHRRGKVALIGQRVRIYTRNLAALDARLRLHGIKGVVPDSDFVLGESLLSSLFIPFSLASSLQPLSTCPRT